MHFVEKFKWSSIGLSNCAELKPGDIVTFLKLQNCLVSVDIGE